MLSFTYQIELRLNLQAKYSCPISLVFDKCYIHGVIILVLTNDLIILNVHNIILLYLSITYQRLHVLGNSNYNSFVRMISQKLPQVRKDLDTELNQLGLLLLRFYCRSRQRCSCRTSGRSSPGGRAPCPDGPGRPVAEWCC